MNQQEIARNFLKREHKHYIGYTELLRIEKHESFKRILEELAEHEQEDVAFWQNFSGDYKPRVSRLERWQWRIMRRVLGLTFTVKYIEHIERQTVQAYVATKDAFDPETAVQIQRIIDQEQQHEKAMIDQIHEKKVEFLSNIVLGLNDGLIELSGALVGFSFAMSSTLLAGASGLITGIAASLSMASSAYLQAKHDEEKKQPVTAALYTGISYLLVVLILVTPFFLFTSMVAALATMAACVLAIVLMMSWYSSVVFQTPFKRQVSEMLVFSIGTAVVAFIIGSLVDFWLIK